MQHCSQFLLTWFVTNIVCISSTWRLNVCIINRHVWEKLQQSVGWEDMLNTAINHRCPSCPAILHWSTNLLLGQCSPFAWYPSHTVIDAGIMSFLLLFAQKGGVCQRVLYVNRKRKTSSDVFFLQNIKNDYFIMLKYSALSLPRFTVIELESRKELCAFCIAKLQISFSTCFTILISFLIYIYRKQNVLR